MLILSELADEWPPGVASAANERSLGSRCSLGTTILIGSSIAGELQTDGAYVVVLRELLIATRCAGGSGDAAMGVDELSGVGEGDGALA